MPARAANFPDPFVRLAPGGLQPVEHPTDEGPRLVGLCLQGRREEATALFERLLSLRNDLGLVSEEYDPQLGRLVGNFPQAFTHLTLVDTALTLSGAPCRETTDEPTDRTA